MVEIAVVHGTPGSGKSTLSERLTQLSDEGRPIFHVSLGNRLRDIRTRSVESRFSGKINNPNAPALLDHRIVNGIIFEYISECPPNSIVLVDGYPSFPDAVGAFIDAIREGNHTLLGCINLEISLETCISRLSGRGVRRGERFNGITPDFVERRYQTHLTYTVEAISALGKLTSAIKVDAEPDIDVVWESCHKAFRQLVDIE